MTIIDERKDTIYETISNALQNSKKGDIIIAARGLYKIFGKYDDYTRYITAITV